MAQTASYTTVAQDLRPVAPRGCVHVKVLCSIFVTSSALVPGCSLAVIVAVVRHKRPQSAGPLISSSNNTAQDGYVHGSLSTAGIAGASPAYQSLTKLEVRQIERLVADGSISHAAAKEATAAARAASPAPAADETDPGMRPKVRIRAHMNRPDLAHITSDIEGAQPNPRDVIKHPRGTNPLNPDYKLAAGWVLHDAV